MQNKHTYIKTVSLSFFIFILIELSVTLIVMNMYEDKKDAVYERKIKVFHDVYESTKKSYSKITKLLVDQTINTPEVIELFEHASGKDLDQQSEIRQKLYKMLLPTYENLKKLNVRQLHFHLPDISSFLRFHQPDKYGDSLVGIRTSLEIANREKRYVEGFEEGRVYNGFRYVYPLFNAQGRHLGSVEASLSFKALSQDIEETIGDKVDFVVKRSIVDRKVWDDHKSYYYQSTISKAYLHEKTEDRVNVCARYKTINQQIAKEASRRMQTKKAFSLYQDGIIITFLPISNVAGEKAAAFLISYEKSDEINTIREDMLFVWVISSFSAFIITVLLFIVLLKVAKIKDLATYDTLTGAYNRRTMTELLEHELERCKRNKKELSVIYLDIDDFKSVNDTYGHEKGDRVLIQIITLIKEALRHSDLVGRWGGEEFLIALPETPSDDALKVTEKLREMIATAKFDIPKSITASFGVTTSRSDESQDKIVGRADRCLYQAKKEGKNKVICFETQAPISL